MSSGTINVRKSAAYVEHDTRLRANYLTVVDIVSVLMVPGGFLLDYLAYPEKAGQFLVVRLLVSTLLLAILGVIWLVRKGPPRPRLLIFLGVASALVINLSFCFMIAITDGARSSYYAGINLIITGMATLLPWRPSETLFVSVVSLVGYVTACIVNAGAITAIPIASFSGNIFFIVLTSTICVISTFFLSRARFQDFLLRHQLNAQNRELQEVDRMKTQFFSNVSHELRTPLTLILGPVETLLGRGDTLDAQAHESMLLVHRNTLRLLKLINDLLDLTRLDEGAEVLRKKSIAVGTFVKGVVDSVRHLGLSKQLRIRVEDGDPSARFSVDPPRMEKVVVNLLTNAIKYTPAGGSITVRWSADGSSVEVSDTGVGIPEQDLPRIFDRFHQVDGNSSNRVQGVGIGLALAKEIVEQHGGTLGVESTVGKGATFRISLPEEIVAGTAGEQSAPAAETISETMEPFEKAFRSADRSWSFHEDMTVELPMVGQGNELVLVADDENDMRRYIVSLLSEDYRVIQTHHGANVKDLVLQHSPALVLLDWMMPGKDGLAVCRELRADDAFKDVKIILLTARIDEKSKLDALASGADDFLTKPFSSVEVRTRVSNLLRTGVLQRDLRLRNTELSDTIGRLQRTEAMLIQSEKMNALGSLSAGLLHEINNPLNYTMSALSFAGQFKASLNDDFKEILGDIEEGMTRIRDVITHLKNFAYPEKPGTESLFLVQEAVDSARKIVAGEILGVDVDARIEDHLALFGQKMQVTHLFMNLLNNAGKALAAKPASEPKIITITARNEGSAIVIEVADNGPGIPAEIMPRIFDPFFTTRKVGEGMGMGLSICRTIMEMHSGTIAAANRPEGGAIFTISFPLAKQDSQS